MSLKIKLKTVLKWKADFAWLNYEHEGEYVTSVSCSLCKKHSSRVQTLRNFNRAFVDGVTGNVKKDNVVKHEKSDMHLYAVKIERPPVSPLELYKTTPIGKSFNKLHEGEFEKLTKLFDLSYLIAKEELPFTKFVPLATLEKKHGVDLGNSYITDLKCQEFTTYISAAIHTEIKKLVINSSYYSILIDGSTDSSHSEKELLFVKLVEDGAPRTVFFKIASLESGKAEGLRQYIVDTLADLNLNSKLIGFCSDGASVNTGRKRGVSALLMESHPWLIMIHCLNHRLELAAKDSFHNTYLESGVIAMLLSMYNLYHRSLKRLRELKSLADIMDDHLKLPQKANGTRWIQHKRRACESLIASYTLIICHLENMTEDVGTKNEDKAKIKGYLKTMKTFKFVSHMLLLKHILDPLAKLSLCLQKQDSDLLIASSLLQKTYMQLSEIETQFSEIAPQCSSFVKPSDSKSDDPPEDNHEQSETRAPASPLQRLLVEAKQSESKDQILTYNDVILNVEGKDVANFRQEAVRYVGLIRDCLEKRFGDLQNNEILNCFKILQSDIWPEITKANVLDNFCNEELMQFVSHFKGILERNGVNIELILGEWRDLKIFAAKHLKHLSPVELWKVILLKYNDQFSNFLHVIQIMMVFPSSNAIVERGFSAMLRIKSDFRSRLGEDILNDLMCITLEGPSTEEFNAKQAVDLFLAAKPRRVNVQPYGPRPKKREAEETVVSLEVDCTNG